MPPARDGKVLADWNGMMIAALARAGFVFERKDWLDAARSAFDFVVANVARDGEMRHSWCANAAGEGALNTGALSSSRLSISASDQI